MSLDLNTYKVEKQVKEVSKSESNIFPFSKNLSDKKKEVFYRELGMLLKSGVDFKKALEILSQQSNHKFEKRNHSRNQKQSSRRTQHL